MRLEEAMDRQPRTSPYPLYTSLPYSLTFSEHSPTDYTDYTDYQGVNVSPTEQQEPQKLVLLRRALPQISQIIMLVIMPTQSVICGRIYNCICRKYVIHTPQPTDVVKRHLYAKPTASRETAQLWDTRMDFSTKVPQSGTYLSTWMLKSPSGEHSLLAVCIFPKLRRFAACMGFRIDVSRRDTLAIKTSCRFLVEDVYKGQGAALGWLLTGLYLSASRR